MTRRSWITLALFGASLLVVLLGIAWISDAALSLVDREVEARRQAAVEENVRLALWRMDSSLAPLIANESARPYFTYAAFYPAGRAYDRMFAELGEGDALVASPLLAETIEHVLLHFQIDAANNVTSPSVPQGKQRDLAIAEHVDEERLSVREQRLAELRSILEKEDLASRLLSEEKAIFAVANRKITDEGAQAAATPKGKSSQEWAFRTRNVQQASSYNNPIAQNADGAYDANQNTVVPQQAQQQVLKAPGGKRSAFEVGEVRQGPLTPLWIKGSLLLARRVRLGGAEYIQGVWLDWASVREWLLSTVRDLLPAAELRAVAEGGGAEERRLASVPAHLIAGALPVDPEPLAKPVKLVLWIAWSGVLLAAAAVAALLFGALALSERRAAFVSAVTHELRTPLTTFRMYSEMLAEGMVKDEAKQKRYLDTLKREAVRLSHLVENVLAFARIERGRHTGKIEELALAEVLDRFGDRMRDRAAQAGMSVVVEKPAAQAKVKADATAVEQILFNLVDNACKYASAADDKTITIATEARGGRLLLRVRDRGPGINRAAKRRLFAPFSRSAEAAAGSAPGVGLGLALSRRLARSMGGELVLEEQAGGGASFALTLPSA